MENKPKQMWHGIPRIDISWFPTMEYFLQGSQPRYI